MDADGVPPVLGGVAGDGPVEESVDQRAEAPERLGDDSRREVLQGLEGRAREGDVEGGGDRYREARRRRRFAARRTVDVQERRAARRRWREPHLQPPGRL